MRILNKNDIIFRIHNLKLGTEKMKQMTRVHTHTDKRRVCVCVRTHTHTHTHTHTLKPTLG